MSRFHGTPATLVVWLDSERVIEFVEPTPLIIPQEENQNGFLGFGTGSWDVLDFSFTQFRATFNAQRYPNIQRIAARPFESYGLENL
jgi:hypothetical protein